MTFKDHFSQQSKIYAISRPRYPEALFSFLASCVSTHELVWDCATGNGQAAIGLIPYFSKIIATDASQQQLTEVQRHPKIQYTCFPAEKTNLAASSVDLITVAMALHWFDLEKFYQEVERVLKPNGIIAVWCFTLGEIEDEAIQKILSTFCFHTLKDYWPKEFSHVNDGYQHLSFPFELISTPSFKMNENWTLEKLLRNINSWSAIQRYMTKHHENPVKTILIPALNKLWANPHEKKAITFKLVLKVGRVNTTTRAMKKGDSI